MPNWCTNTLNVEGNEKSIAAFRAAARGQHAGYNSYRPSKYGGEESWPVHDDVRVKAAVKEPAPLYGKEYDICMNALFPVPEDFRRFPFDCNQARKLGEIVGEERPYGGYTWQTDNWGSKWDIEGELLEEESTFLQYRFESPWSPPANFIEKVAEDFPDLTFTLEYYEPGMGFAGRLTCEGEYSNDEALDIDDFVEPWDEEE